MAKRGRLTNKRIEEINRMGPPPMTGEKDPSEEAIQIVKNEQEAEEKRKKELLDCAHVAQLLGEAIGHKEHRILSMFREFKTISEIQKDKGYLKIPGVMSLEQLLESRGYSRRSAYRWAEIVRAFDEEFVPFLAQMHPSQRDLIEWGKLPKDRLREIFKEDADIEEMREKLREECLENKRLQEEKAAEKKTSERLLQAKQALIDRQARGLLDLEEENKSLKEKVNGRLPKVNWTDEEKEYNQILAACQMQFMEIIATIRGKIPLDKAPPLIITQLYFLYIEMAATSQEERIKLTQYDDGSTPGILYMDGDEIPPAEMMIANMPLTAPAAEAFNRWRERKKKTEAQSKKGERECEA